MGNNRIHGKTIILFCLIFSGKQSFAQCPSVVVENKTKIFYKGVLNECYMRRMKGGEFTISVDNGEQVTKDGKMFIKPSKAGKVTIKIKEYQEDKVRGTKTAVELYDYFDCVELPAPGIAFITGDKKIINVTNRIQLSSCREIKGIVTTNLLTNVICQSTIESYTITIFGQKGKSKTVEVSNNDISAIVYNMNAGDKVSITNIKAKIEGQTEDINLDNRFAEIVQ